MGYVAEDDPQNCDKSFIVYRLEAISYVPFLNLFSASDPENKPQIAVSLPPLFPAPAPQEPQPNRVAGCSTPFR